ncbi:AMP-binding protein [Fodinicola feengrottensis]|uniref:AMP-binding protein n=1 Tax=Fodinicola feengrottensis TaxID=435914 RepID=UPI0013D3A6C9|nr:AMP-binding protein [Fodinicola feengrottensis]
MIAVPVAAPAPPRPDVGMERLLRIVGDAGAEALLLSGDLPVELPAGVAAIRVDRPGGDPAGWRDPGVRPETIAFLQYTSGSTRIPRGAVVGHGNLAANLDALGHALAVPPGSTSVSWLPLYHDMGLIAGLLLAASSGGTAYLMSPLHFLQRPVRWLSAVSTHHGFISGAPNFAYDLAVSKVKPTNRPPGWICPAGRSLSTVPSRSGRPPWNVSESGSRLLASGRKM